MTNFLLAYAAQYKKISRLVNASACICMISLLVLGPTAEYLRKSWICVVGVMFIGMGTAVGFSSVLPSRKQKNFSANFFPRLQIYFVEFPNICGYV